MNTRRKLTRNELNSLIARLEEMRSSIEESYEYPLADLIDYLKKAKQRGNNEVEEDSAGAQRYYLYFSSPAETWQMLCGRAGIYTVDAETLKAVDFNLTILN